MTRDEILNAKERLAPWFHRIDLGNGIFTKTESMMGEPVDNPREMWEVIGRCLPADLRGKTVLDVGCNGGFYSVEAKRRGARRVLGVDGQRHHVRQALFVRKALGLDLEFRRFSIYNLTPEIIGRFDITLALGLVYHLKHLVLALERLFGLTNELLIVESAIIPPEGTPLSFRQTLGSAQQLLHPIFYADNSPDAKEQVFNWFLPSTAALEALLRNVGFAEVALFAVIHDRAVFVCRKRSDGKTQPTVGDYVARMEFVGTPPAICQSGADLGFALRLTNAGQATWQTIEHVGLVRVGAHLLRADEEEVDWDWTRVALPRELKPGEVVELQFTVKAPRDAGDYIIEFDMVAEHVTWFEDFGAGTLRYRLAVR
jgi:tRNA (mo5U34)-methyltransferase